MLEAYRQHVEERAAEGVPPKPLTAEQVAALIELLKAPPAGEEASADDANEADPDARATLPVSRQDDNIYVGF